MDTLSVQPVEKSWPIFAINLFMNQKITGYHQDAEQHWVAELECGHNQHVRHQPPWSNRAWVLTAEGRNKMLGEILHCKKCDRAEPRDNPVI